MMTGSEIRNREGEAIDYTFHPSVRSDALIVLGHGLTGNKDRPLLVALAQGLSALGWPCLRLSFAGNGDSAVKFEDSCVSKDIRDLQAVLDVVPANVSVVFMSAPEGRADLCR